MDENKNKTNKLLLNVRLLLFESKKNVFPLSRTYINNFWSGYYRDVYYSAIYYERKN